VGLVAGSLFESTDDHAEASALVERPRQWSSFWGALLMTEERCLFIMSSGRRVATRGRKWGDIYSREGTEEENDCIPQPISSIRTNA
jgi:hypothetical protein